MVEFRKKSVQDIDVSGKTVLIRVDYNVPIKDGVIQELQKIGKVIQAEQFLIGNH